MQLPRDLTQGGILCFCIVASDTDDVWILENRFDDYAIRISPRSD